MEKRWFGVKKITIILSLLMSIASFSEEIKVTKDGNDNYIIEPKKGFAIPGNATHKEQKIEKGNNNIIYGRVNLIKEGDDKNFSSSGESDNNVIKGDDNEISITNYSTILGNSNNIYGMKKTHIIGDNNIVRVDNKRGEEKEQKLTKESILAFGDRNEIYNSRNSYALGNNNEIYRAYNSLALGEQNIIKSKVGEIKSNYSLAFGFSNKIIDSEHSTTIGESNEIKESDLSFANGINNNIEKSNWSSAQGYGNKIDESQLSYAQGYNNKIIKSGSSHIQGDENEIKKSNWSSAQGYGNKIVESQLSYVQGYNNEIIKSGSSHIQGDGNKINESASSYIIGDNSEINKAKHSVIIGGYLTRVNMANSIAIGAFSNTREIKNKGYLTNQSVDGVYSLAIGGEYKYKDDKGKEHLIKAKRRIQGLADGAEDDEAVTVAQLKKVEGKIAQVEKIDKKAELALGGVSNAIAMANLVQVSSYSKHRHNLSAAYGYYSGAHALAIGFSGINKERNFVYKLSGSVNNHGNLAFGLGLGVMLGSKDNEYPVNSKKVEKLEKANKELMDKISKIEQENMKIKEMLHKLLEK